MPRPLFGPVPVLLATAFASLTPVRVYANDQPPTQPMLRIETGMHAAVISRMGVDAAGRYLVTGSKDKTVRVWDAHTGALLRTLRPPSGDGNAGRIDSVAISPDGRTIACGGWTHDTWQDGKDVGGFCVLLFDRESGALLRQMGGMPNVIKDLAFSHDNRFVAAGIFGRGSGVRVFRASDGSLVGKDTDYGNDCYGVDFDGTNHLITSSFDGSLRLYTLSEEATNALRLVRKAVAPDGTQPFAIRFSPDGTKIAVGYANSLQVSLLSAADLLQLPKPNCTGFTNGALYNVTWSRDSTLLYAGGTAWNFSAPTRGYVIRRWTGSGAGSFTDIPAAQNTIMDMRAADSLFFCSADPTIGALDTTSSVRLFFLPPPIADYRDQQSVFQIARDASSLHFRFSPYAPIPATFSLPLRALELTSSGSSLGSSDPILSPITQASGLSVTDWRYTYAPKLNGIPLPMEPQNMSRSLAIVPDGNSFLLGADWNLLCFGRDGKPKWTDPVPDATWDVNVSSDGRVGVAAFADGTIRWYRMSDGQELLALFPHADRKRWVLWTPQGYYDCSPGGEDLIGWQINRGKDKAADFFPASQFHETFYRPDVIQKVLTTLDVTEALRQANAERGKIAPAPAAPEQIIAQALPPVVRILSPADDTALTSDSVTVRFAVRTAADAPITEVRALVDGRPADAARGMNFSKATAAATSNTDHLETGEEARQVVVPVPAGAHQIAVLAENRNALSTPATVRVSAPRSAPVASDSGPDAAANLLKPKLYILAVGVGKYANLPGADLTFPATDAKAFVAAVQKQKGGLYRDVEVKLLTDTDATRDNVTDGLDWLQHQTTARDVAMVFFAGHGANNDQNIYHFLPYNFDSQHFKTTGVTRSDIDSSLKAIPGKVFLFLDTCDAGNVMGGAKSRGVLAGDMTEFINALASTSSGVVVYCASNRSQSALEDPAWGDGAFTKALIEGISGQADPKLPLSADAATFLSSITRSRRVTISLLEAYVAERVKGLTQGRQTPVTTKPETIPDLTIATLQSP